MRMEISVLIILLLYGILFLTVHKMGKNGKANSELVRKVLHIGSGSISLLFPLLFKTRMSVVYLGLFFLVLLLILRNLKKIKDGLGKTLRKDDRNSRGDIYFIISIVLLWVLSFPNPALYYIPMSILIFADALAALGGIKYGKRKYKSVVGEKSIEGSSIFFLVTLIISLFFLAFFGGISPENCILTALLMAILAMILEAISWRGLDNIFVPLLCFFILQSSIGADTYILGINVLVTVILFLLVIFGVKKSLLSDDAALTGAFYTYFVWILGGVSWTMATISLYAIYRSVTLKAEYEKLKPYDFKIMITICLPCLFWLVVYSITQMNDIFFLYITVIASHLSIIGVARMRHSHRDVDSKRVVLINSFIGISYLTILIIIFMYPFERMIWAFSGTAVILSTLIFNRLQPVKENYLLNKNRLIKHSLVVFFCSFIVLIPILL